MLTSSKFKVHSNNVETQNNVAISPLAILILEGLSPIVITMNYVTHASFIHVGIVTAILAIMLLSLFLTGIITKK